MDNLYAQKGSKVKYTGCTDLQVSYAGNSDPRNHLIEGEVYEIDHTDVSSWSTEVYLIGYENMCFNSVCFEDVL